MVLGRSNCTLGQDSVVGRWIRDISGKFKIIICGISANRFHSLLPDRPAFEDLSQLVRFYVNQPLACELEIKLDTENVETARLGEKKWSSLGWNTWLFSSPPGPGKARTAFTVL